MVCGGHEVATRRSTWPPCGCATSSARAALSTPRRRRVPARRAGARSPRAGTWRRSAATPACRRRCGPGKRIANSTRWLLLGMVSTCLRVLLVREHLFEQRLELHFAEHAARLDVGQHALQVADALRQRLHLAQPLVHLLQPVGHLLEAFAQPRLQRGLQLLVDRAAHLLELGGVGLLQHRQLRLQRARALPPGAARSIRDRPCSWSVKVSASVFCSSVSCCAKASICVFWVRVASAACLHERRPGTLPACASARCARRATIR